MAVWASHPKPLGENQPAFNKTPKKRYETIKVLLKHFLGLTMGNGFNMFSWLLGLQLVFVDVYGSVTW